MRTPSKSVTPQAGPARRSNKPDHTSRPWAFHDLGLLSVLWAYLEDIPPILSPEVSLGAVLTSSPVCNFDFFMGVLFRELVFNNELALQFNIFFPALTMQAYV